MPLWDRSSLILWYTVYCHTPEMSAHMRISHFANSAASHVYTEYSGREIIQTYLRQKVSQRHFAAASELSAGGRQSCTLMPCFLIRVFSYSPNMQMCKIHLYQYLASFYRLCRRAMGEWFLYCSSCSCESRWLSDCKGPVWGVMVSPGAPYHGRGLLRITQYNTMGGQLHTMGGAESLQPMWVRLVTSSLLISHDRSLRLPGNRTVRSSHRGFHQMEATLIRLH